MLKIKFTLLFLAIFSVVSLTSQSELVNAQSDERLFVVLVDRHALADSQNNKDLSESFIGLISTLRDGQQIGFAVADNPSVLLGPAESGSPEFRNNYRDIIASLASSEQAHETNMVGAIGEILSLFDEVRAPADSTLYVLTGGDNDETELANSDRLSQITHEFQLREWPIIGIGLPGSSVVAQEFLSRVTSETGGELFPLSVPDGYINFSNSILGEEARGALQGIDQGSLVANEVLTSPLKIAPGTLETTLVFFKHGPGGSLSLKNPSGFEAAEGDRSLSKVIETPFVVMWQLTEPAPGEWTVEFRGIEGQVSTWSYTANKFSVDFVSFNAVPFDQPVPIVAFVTDGLNRVVPEGAELRARLTDTQGRTLAHKLNDEGILGDAVPGDGFYSTVVSPFGVEGDYQVELELYWPEFDHFVSTNTVVSAQGFPTIGVAMLQTDNLQLAERTKIATAQVHVKGQPYAIPTSELNIDLATTIQDAGAIQLVPQDLVSSGHASAFDIYLTPLKEDLHTVILRLDMEYAGREYTYTTDSFVLSSLIPAPPVEPVIPPAPIVQQVEAPAPAPVPQGSSPIGLLAIPAVIIVALVVAGIYLITRPKPYGYLYNDTGELLVDFSSLKRQAVAAFFSKNSVKGNETGVKELEGVSFRFSRVGVDIRSARTEPTVRINNQPLIEGQETSLFNQSWIGTQGKLFSFLTSRPSTIQPEPGVGDD